MRKILFFAICAVFYIFPCFSQSTKTQRQIDSINVQISYFKEQITQSSQKIIALKEQLIVEKFKESTISEIKVKVTEPIRLFSEKFLFSDTICLTRKNDTLTIFDYGKEFYTVKYKNRVGYVNRFSIPLNDEICNFVEYSILRKLENENDPDKKSLLQLERNIFNRFKREYENDKIENQKFAEKLKLEKENQKNEQELARQCQIKRQADLNKKYGGIIAKKIIEGKIWLGMSSEMAQESWGSPKDINRTVNQYSVSEQWVYSDAYLYFENGILKSFQD